MNKRGLFLRLGRMSPMERRKGRYMRAPDGHGDGGDGGAAGLLEGGGGDGGQGDGGQGGGGDSGQGGGDGGQGGGDPWYSGLSDQAGEGGGLADRAWLENKKYADLPALVKAHRELEGRFLAGDKIVLPMRARVIDDWRRLWKRWSVQLMALMVAAQTVWAAVPAEARQLLPGPEYIGIGLGVSALLAMIFKQGKKDGE